MASEEQEKLNKLRAANKQIEELSAKIPGIMEAERKRLEAEGEARLAATRAQAAEVHEKIVQQPRKLDSATDHDAIFKASINGTDIMKARNENTIYKWDDGYGRIIYLRPDVRGPQVPTISGRITAQEEAFNQLGSDKQLKARAEFKSPTGVAGSTQPYKDFLQSEALGKRFQQLKQP